ncbi:CF062-like protein [Mya arenaria]|uniref:CF062-like protein n=1 Tax=Mya arenaria TaxID=6604 RepID=A0ABY7FQK8_MYAAR|nr:CF062-like protein [Mya arenaria]
MSTNLGDPSMRKSCMLRRLQNQLKKKQESLADHFSFKMLITFYFKGKKENAVFEVSEVIPVMTNNYEECIMEGAKRDAYSEESTKELLEKDIDLIGCTSNVDYFLWPRKDLDRIECTVFSKWKDEIGPYRKIEASFEFCHSDIEKQSMYLLSCKDDSGLIVANPEQNVFLFVDRLNLQTQTKVVTILKLCSVCVYLPQDQLMNWGLETMEQTRDALQLDQSSND